MNGICFNMGLVEVAENTVGLLEFMAEEMFVGSWVRASFGWCDKGIVA